MNSEQLESKDDEMGAEATSDYVLPVRKSGLKRTRQDIMTPRLVVVIDACKISDRSTVHITICGIWLQKQLL